MSKVRRRRKRHGRKNWFSKLSIGQKIGICSAGVVVALMASGVIFVAAKLGKIDSQEIDKEDIVINSEVEELGSLGEGYTNVALFGVDSREGDLGKGTRTDCIIVASLNNETQEVKMASVYRDTLLDLSEGTLQKCNAAYSFGGPTQAINMLNMNLDLDIQKYVTVDFGVVAEVVDLLGGVEIELKEEEIKYLNQYLEETASVAGKEAHFVEKAGLQNLDGPQATTYARIRSTAGGDFTRTERQRLVIEKMVEKIIKSDLRTINSIVDKVFPTISTNFTATEILSYAKYFSKYQLGDNTGFPIDKTTDTISGLGSIVIPVNLQDNVKKLHEFLFGATDYTVSSKVQSISNAIVARVGQRKATDDTTLSKQTYTPTAEDRAQESNNYTAQKKNPSNGGNENAADRGDSGEETDNIDGDNGGDNGDNSGENGSSTGGESGDTSSGSEGDVTS